MNQLPNIRTLYPHQVEGIKFLKDTKKAILAHDMGLGKTMQAIIAAKESNNSEEQTLVVCPASLKTNWSREIKAIYPQDDVNIISGRKSPGGAIVAPWTILNYDILSYQKDYLEENGHFGTIVLDEAHYIKGRSIRAKSTIEISGMAPRVYCLTGTPLLNRPIELFNILKAIGHYLGKNRTEYAYRYCGAFWIIQFQDRSSNRKFFTTQDKAKFYYGSKQYKQTLRFLDESGATNLDELRKNLKGCMQRIRKEDVLNLPPKIIDVQEVEMNNLQRREYDNAWDNYLDFLRANPPEDTTIENIMATRQLVEITKLKQICSRAKIDRIVADSLNAIEQNNKVIIFSQYTDTIDYIAKGLREEKIQVATLKGENDQAERQEAVDQFQTNPKVMAFVANIKAAGVGITLSKGSIVIFADMDWSPEVHTQAEDRAHRIGTTGTVNVHYYICKNTIEEDIVEILTYKKQIVQEVIDGTKKRVETGSAVHDFLKRMNDRARL